MMRRKCVFTLIFLIIFVFSFTQDLGFLSEYEKNTMKISVNGVFLDYPLSYFERFDPKDFESIFEAEIMQVINPCEYILDLHLNGTESVGRFNLIGLKCSNIFDLDNLLSILPNGKKIYVNYDPISKDGNIYMWLKISGRYILVNAILMLNGYAQYDTTQKFFYKVKFEKLWNLVRMSEKP